MKILGVIVPPACAIVFSILIESAIAPFRNHPLLLSVSFSAMGIAAGLITLWLVRLLNTRAGWKPVVWGTVKSAFIGTFLGLLVSLSSGILFHFTNDAAENYSAFSKGLGRAAIANVSPAFLEEAGFRGGLVNGLLQWGGTTAGMIGGSVPFGLAHLAGRLQVLGGQPVGLLEVIGTTLAGLLLTLIYLRYGLWAAIGCHWAWNTLCGGWIRFLGLPKPGGVQAFEGAWTTSLVLLAVSALIALQFRKKRHQE